MNSGTARKTDVEPEPTKIKAEDNPWYLLATLYGVPEEFDRELSKKNRIAFDLAPKFYPAVSSFLAVWMP
jgi:hypothetical protein